MPEPSRQLAAIMFTDIVGYTALMGKDEAKAMQLLEQNRNVQKPLIEQYRGKYLKDIGDAILASFGSAGDAVSCALAIQNALSDDQELTLRIGIHSGDITFKDEDVFGDGVNIASRIQSIADPGGIYISESIHKAIRGRSDIQAQYLGETQLKNVDYPVKTYALQGIGLPVPEIKEDQHLKGHLWAEVQRRGVVRAGATYIVLALLAVLVLPHAEAIVNLPQWSATALMGILIAGFPIAVYLAWSYEKSPEGFVKTTSQQSWQNPYSVSQRKPLTGTVMIVALVLIMTVLLLFPQKRPPGSGEDITRTIQDKSIAVLAFADMSPDGDQEYFCDGISDEIINSLAQIKALKVIGRSSSFQFKGQNPDHREVGEKLGVSTLLEGSIRKSGDKIRITAQLIDVEDGSHIWSHTYDRDLDDIFKIQDEISEAIAQQMKVSMGLTKRNPMDLEVYDLYLKARTLLFQRGPGVELSIKLFKQIIEQDSTYQPAWRGLAQAWIVLPEYTRIDSLQGNWKISLDNAMRAAQKALSLDPNDPEVLAAIATVLKSQRKFGKAYDNYEKAMAINDQSPVILKDYVHFLLLMGYDREAMPYAQRMVDLDPLTPLYLVVYSWALAANGLTQEQLNTLKKVMSIDPNFRRTAESMVFAYLNTNRIDSALYVLGRYRYSFREDVHYDWVRQIEAVKQGNLAFDFGQIRGKLTFAMIELNQIDALFNTLQLRERTQHIGGIRPPYAHQGITHLSESFLSDPRMKELLRKYGFVEFWKKYGWPDRCRPVGNDDFVCE